MFHLLLWGSLPTDSQRTHLSQRLARYMEGVPQIVHQAIQVLPYVYRASQKSRSCHSFLSDIPDIIMTVNPPHHCH